MKQLVSLLTIACWLTSTSASAQPLSVEDSPPLTSADQPTWLGLTILGNPSLSFNSVNDYVSGVSVDHVTIQLALSLGLRWTLQVRALGDLQSGAYSIPVSTISIQPINLGNSSTITLSTTNQTLAFGQLTQLLTLSPTFRYKAQGGGAFYKPAGQYTTTLVFTFTPL